MGFFVIRYFLIFGAMENQKDIKKTAQQVANVNAQRRRLKRKEDKELARINEYFTNIKTEFCRFIFGFDWDDVTHLDFGDGVEVPIDELNAFEDFNNKWVGFCNKWKANNHHNTPINPMAFHEWGIDNTKTNKNDTIANIGGIERAIL